MSSTLERAYWSGRIDEAFGFDSTDNPFEYMPGIQEAWSAGWYDERHNIDPPSGDRLQRFRDYLCLAPDVSDAAEIAAIVDQTSVAGGIH